MQKSPVERFFSRVNLPENPEDCWVWWGTKSNRGYGELKVSGKVIRAHRFSWELHVGPIPEGLLIRHTCDNPSCVNPSHLLLGTDAMNAADRKLRGRGIEGEAHPMVVLSDREVREIRDLVKHRALTQVKIAEIYGICQGSVNGIARGVTRQSAGTF
jgi:HNH endonuclease